MSYEYDDMCANSDRGYEMQLDRIIQNSQKDTTIEDTEAFFAFQNKKEYKLSELINENTFIISDTHFGDYRIEEYEPSRVEFANSLNLPIDDAMIKIWNDTVKPDDVVLHLGDFAYKSIQKYTKALNGIKVLLRGNHDTKSADTYCSLGWDYIIETPTVEINNNVYKDMDNKNKYKASYSTTILNKKLLFTHFPLFATEYKDERFLDVKDKLEQVYKDMNCEINIHGHTHSKCLNNDFSINVSIENIGFRPVQIKSLLASLSMNNCINNLNKSLERNWDKLIKKKPISKIMQKNYDHLGIRYAKQE
jgi:calcineurin-like phosphoesterase family protein